MGESAPTFDDIWRDSVIPLRGTTIRGVNGLTNQIVEVDWNGVIRISRSGLRSRIPMEPFRWAVARILQRGWVERREIHEAFPHRYSSGVQLVLEQVPSFVAYGRPARIASKSFLDRAQRFVDQPGDIRIIPPDKRAVSDG